MAQITWRNVEAPNLSTRDIAYASESVTAGFDRLADVLNQRDARLNEKATSALQGRALLASTPEQIAALQAELANGKADPRADMNIVAGSLNQRAGQISEQQMRDIQIAEAEDTRINSQDYALLTAARGSGNQAEVDRLTQILAGRNARNIGGALTEGDALFEAEQDEKRQIIESDRDYNLRAGSAALQNRATRLQIDALEVSKKERDELKAAMAEIDVLARNGGPNGTSMDPAQIEQVIASKYPIAVRLGVLDQYNKTAAVFDKNTEDQLYALSDLTNTANTARTGLQNMIDLKTREVVGNRPEAEVLLYAERNADKYVDVKPEDVQARLDTLGYENVAGFGSDGSQLYEQLSKIGLKKEEILGLLDSGAALGGEDRLLALAQKAQDFKTNNELATIRSNVAAVTAGYTRELAEINRNQIRLGREVARANQPRMIDGKLTVPSEVLVPDSLAAEITRLNGIVDRDNLGSAAVIADRKAREEKNSGAGIGRALSAAQARATPVITEAISSVRDAVNDRVTTAENAVNYVQQAASNFLAPRDPVTGKRLTREQRVAADEARRKLAEENRSR